LCISLRVSVYATSECSQDLPSYNETTFTGDALTGSHGGVQLLIPLWNFSCDGTIEKWMAHVTGDSSVANSIEFQIFQPDPVKENVYNLIYGNMYNGAGAVGSRITVTPGGLNLRIPIRVGYIVGLHVTSDALNMLYESTGDVDIYYWENVTERRCSLSLCDAKVIRGVNPLIGWIFRDLSDQGLRNLEDTIQLAKESNMYQCSTSNISNCTLNYCNGVHCSLMTTNSNSQESTTTYVVKETSNIKGTPTLLATSSTTIDSPTYTIIKPSSVLEQDDQGDHILLILIICVAVLLFLSIFLTMALIVIFSVKLSKKLRTRKEHQNNKENKKLSTGANPAYRLHTIISPNNAMEGVDSNKMEDYDEVDADEGYYQPEPSIYMQARKDHTYGNIDHSNHIYNNVGPRTNRYVKYKHEDTSI
jgi:hypothetical protein